MLCVSTFFLRIEPWLGSMARMCSSQNENPPQGGACLSCARCAACACSAPLNVAHSGWEALPAYAARRSVGRHVRGRPPDAHQLQVGHVAGVIPRKGFADQAPRGWPAGALESGLPIAIRPHRSEAVSPNSRSTRAWSFPLMIRLNAVTGCGTPRSLRRAAVINCMSDPTPYPQEEREWIGSDSRTAGSSTTLTGTVLCIGRSTDARRVPCPGVLFVFFFCHFGEQ